MTTVLLPNLLFEEEVQGRVSSVSPSAKRMAAELGCVMGLLASETPPGECPFPPLLQGDTLVLVAPDAMPEDLPASLSGVQFVTVGRLRRNPLPQAGFLPWGWSPAAVEAGRQLDLNFEPPDQSVVRRINSREFQSTVDRCVTETGEPIKGLFGTVCRRVEDVKESIGRMAGCGSARWVIKAELSHAARNRRLGSGPEISSPDQAWIRNRIDQGEIVYVEPWVERIAECGLQYAVESNGGEPTVWFAGACEMLTDKAGRYKGSLIGRDPISPWWQPAVSHGMMIARMAGEAGFRGALGIDCMVCFAPDSGQRLLRMSHDINGRMTMGRVALALQCFLQPGESGCWLQLERKVWNRFPGFGGGADAVPVRVVPTSPDRMGGRPCGVLTGLLVSESRAHLRDCATDLIGLTVPRVG